jgi:hypothetical protein
MKYRAFQNQSRYFIIIALLGILCVPFVQVAMGADEADSEDWPNEVEGNYSGKTPSYFNSTDNPILQKYNESGDRLDGRTFPPAGTVITTPITELGEPEKEKKFSLWPFNKKKEEAANSPISTEKKTKKSGLFNKSPKVKPLTDDQITKVGPREMPSIRDPLFGLPVTLQNSQGHPIEPGFYLVRSAAPTDSTRELTLWKENKAVLTVMVLREFSELNSPITQQNPAHPAPLAPQLSVKTSAVDLSANPTEEPQTAVFIWREGEHVYKSEPLPLHQRRKELLY